MTLENIERRSRELMNAHGLQNWEFGFDRGTKRLGATYCHSKKITISRHLATLNPWVQIKETMLHEIAHALCGSTEGHGRVWKEMYVSIGGTAERDYSLVKMPPLKVGHCPSCKRVVRHRRRSAVACSVCCRKFNHGAYTDKYKIVWR